jgi:hypothetical protein
MKLIPGTGWPRIVFFGVISLVAALAIYLVIYRIFFQGQDLARERGNSVVAEEQVAAEGAIVDNTLSSIRERDIFRTHTTTIVRESTKEIDNAWTGEQVGQDVDVAGSTALCKLHNSLCRLPADEAVQPVR